MSRYIDADALLKGWNIELPKKRPIQGKQSKEFLAFMKKYENHPFYLAILDIYLEKSADVVETKVLRLLLNWAIECGFGYDSIPEEYEKYKDDIQDMSYADGLIYIAMKEVEDEHTD